MNESVAPAPIRSSALLSATTQDLRRLLRIRLLQLSALAALLAAVGGIAFNEGFAFSMLICGGT